MPKVTVLAIAIGTVTMFFAFGAGALPLTPVKSQPVFESNMTLVRDGCGRGYYYSERLDVNIAKRVVSTIVGKDARTAILGEEAISTVAGSHIKPALPLADKRQRNHSGPLGDWCDVSERGDACRAADAGQSLLTMPRDGRKDQSHTLECGARTILAL